MGPKRFIERINLEKAVALSDWIRFGGEPCRRTGGREHEFGKCALENRLKSLHIRPLLRSGLQGSQEACQIRQHGLDGRSCRMGAGNRQPRLSTMSGLRGHAMQQERSARDCLEVFVRLGQSHKQIPPVVHQRHHAGHQSAARELLGGIPAPSPLILS